jgi:hypothetical protein
MADGIGDSLNQKIGGMPVWLLGGGLGVAYLGFQWFRKRQLPAKPVATGANASDQAQGIYYVPQGTQQTTTPTTGATYADNQAWGNAAINFLIASGYDTGVADDAVRNYLASNPITAQQQAMINLALGKLGPPPQSLPPVLGGTPPPTGGNTGPLSPPASFMAEFVTSTSVALAWGPPVVGATNYIITNENDHATVPSWAFSANITGLKPKTTYRFSVQSQDITGTRNPAVSAKKTISVTTKS